MHLYLRILKVERGRRCINFCREGGKTERKIYFEKMYQLTEYEEWLCSEIVDCAYKVHKELGPGLLEKIYEACFCYELEKKGIKYQRQVDLPVFYDGRRFEEGLRMDVLVDEIIICELKAIETVNPLWQAQIISHLKLSKNNIGFLINFNVELIKNGIRRFGVE